MQPTYVHRIIGLLLFLNLCFICQAKEENAFVPLSGGCINSATQYVVNGNIPAPVTATVASGGSCTSYSYQWQQSTDNVYFTDIPGATGQNLSFTATLPQTTYFQRKTVCGNEVAYTGSVAVNMIAKFYYNVADTGVYTRDNCPSGGAPQPYSYIVRAGKYSSPFSQADADAKAQKDLADSGMYYARLKGVCLWYNVEKRDTLNRNNCGTGVGSSYIYIVKAKKYSSTVSQTDADAKAQKDVNDSTQYYANKLGICTWYNTARDSTTTKKDCPDGTTPTSYKYIVAAGKYASTISQADADAKAIKDIKDSTQLKANANGTCQNLFISLRSGGAPPGYFNISITNSSGVVVYQKTAIDGVVLPISAALPASPWYTVNVASPEVMYTIVNGSRQQKTMNSSASFSATNVIKVEVSATPLYYSAYAEGNFIKSCPEGYLGSTVTYSVYEGKHTSTIDQLDADAKAKKEVSNSGQAYANRVGTCTLAQMVNITLTNYFPSGTPPNMSVTFIKDNVAVKSSSFPSTGTGSLVISLPAGTYNMTFNAPGAPVGMPLGWNLRPQDYYWSKPYNSTTITTGPITFVYGTAYTIMANKNL